MKSACPFRPPEDESWKAGWRAVAYVLFSIMVWLVPGRTAFAGVPRGAVFNLESPVLLKTQSCKPTLPRVRSWTFSKTHRPHRIARAGSRLLRDFRVCKSAHLGRVICKSRPFALAAWIECSYGPGFRMAEGAITIASGIQAVPRQHAPCAFDPLFDAREPARTRARA